MDRHGLSEQDAFSFIQKRAMSERTKMKTIAERVVAGDLTPS
jgi:AmiR/NasT family two-component response regulator